MYSAKLLEHFEHPRNAGELADATATARLENPVCGDVLQLWLRVEDARICAATFKAKGCVPAVACASALTELISNVSIAHARSVSTGQVEAAVEGVPAQAKHAAALAIDCLHAALDSLGSANAFRPVNRP
jgi:nitrogen fixation NifU-like protein